MRLDPTDLRPVYRQVADQLRQAITSGTYAPGDKLPSARALAREFGIAPNTAASAVDQLRGEGLIASWQGRGVYVLEPGQRPAAGPSPQRLADLEADVSDLRREVAALRDQVTGLSARIGARAPGDEIARRHRRQT
jgi:DNA-binding GntR family transcriptional regulator